LSSPETSIAALVPLTGIAISGKLDE
jgi:hypothetical protein